jgi:hypothetical protein
MTEGSDKAMREKLSSSWTFHYKWMVPALSLVICSVALLFKPWYASAKYADYSLFMKVGISFACLVVLWFVIRDARRLKEVWLDGDILIVKGYKAQVSIPLTQIEELKVKRLDQFGTVKVRLRTPQDWGDEFEFMPLLKFGKTFEKQPVVEMLRKRIMESRGHLT